MYLRSLHQNTKVVVFCSPELDKTSFLTTSYPAKYLTPVTPPPPGADHLYLLSVPYRKQQIQVEFWFIHIEHSFNIRRPVTEDQADCMEDARIAIGLYDPINARSFNRMTSWIKGFFGFTRFSFNLELFILALGDNKKSVIRSTIVDRYARRVQAKVYRINPSKLFYRYRLKRTLFADMLMDIHHNNTRFLRTRQIGKPRPTLTTKLLRIVRSLLCF